MDRHPGNPEGVAAAAPLQGRWVAAITDVGGERLGEQLAIQVQVHPLASVRVLERHRSQRRRHQIVPKASASRSCWMLSPSSGIHPAMKSSACTCSLPVAALEMTAPP